MNKAEFIKSLDALTEELKNETQISDGDLLKVYKLGWKDAVDAVRMELEYGDFINDFIKRVDIEANDGDFLDCVVERIKGNLKKQQQ